MLHKDLLIKLARARSLLAETSDSPRSIAQVADHIRMSRYHFIRLFKAVFGLTPNQYQIQERLKLAKRLLMQTDRSVRHLSGGWLRQPRQLQYAFCPPGQDDAVAVSATSAVSQ